MASPPQEARAPHAERRLVGVLRMAIAVMVYNVLMEHVRIASRLMVHVRVPEIAVER